MPLLSIIITSYTMDRLNDIRELLDSIKAQTYPNIEIIFVAERSRELHERIKDYTQEKGIANSKVVFNDGEPGLSAGRNFGIRKAKGGIIAFVDDDSLPFPDWAEEIVKTYEDSSVIGATGPILPLWKDEPMEWFPSEFDWILGCCLFLDINEKRAIRNAGGPNMSFRREAFDVAGLFLTELGAKGGGGGIGKQDFAGEETELSIRVRRATGKSLLYNPAVRVYSKVYKYRAAPTFIAKRAYSEGYTKAMFNRTYRGNNSSEKLLRVEYQLLGRIFTKLFPDIFKRFFTNPIIAWHRFSVTIIALSFVALGYFSYS